ncbi:hypothetical protein GC163_24675 [bacterium]|nr:hypothetical protein [bacterium]
MQSKGSKSVVWTAGLLAIGLIVLVDGVALRADDAVPTKPVYLPAPTETERELQAVFDQRTDLSFVDVPLRDSMEFLRDLHKVNFILDKGALQDEGIDESTPISIEISGVTLRSALRLLLDPLHLTWVIRDEVIVITTRVKVETEFLTRVYPVGDLVAESVDDLEMLAQTIEQGTNGRWRNVIAIAQGQSANNAHMIAGGTVSQVTRVRSLVVKQTLPVHEEIVELLTQLRAAKKLVEQP